MAKEASTTETKARGKKGDGPVTVSYIDGDNKPSKRVPAVVSAIVVTPRSAPDKAVSFSPDNLPVAIRAMLVAAAVAKRIDQNIRNGVEPGATAEQVIAKANEAFELLNSGKLYSRAEGAGVAGAGRPFDYDLYVEAIKMTADVKKKPATDAQLSAFKTKLEGMTPKDRREHLVKLQKDPVFNVSLKKVQASRAQAALKTKGANVDGIDALADAF